MYYSELFALTHNHNEKNLIVERTAYSVRVYTLLVVLPHSTLLP